MVTNQMDLQTTYLPTVTLCCVEDEGELHPEESRDPWKAVRQGRRDIWEILDWFLTKLILFTIQFNSIQLVAKFPGTEVKIRLASSCQSFHRSVMPVGLRWNARSIPSGPKIKTSVSQVKVKL